MKLSERDGKVIIEAEERDTGNELMTVGDLASLLQVDRSSVRRLTKGKAQRSARHPLPFMKLHGKLLRFSRAKGMEWIAAHANEMPVFAPVKGKKKREMKRRS